MAFHNDQRKLVERGGSEEVLKKESTVALVDSNNKRMKKSNLIKCVNFLFSPRAS